MENFPTATPSTPQPLPQPQPQYFSLEPKPELPEPWFKSKRVHLMMGAGMFAMVFVALLVLFALNFTKNGTLSSERAMNVQTAQNLMETQASACAEGDTACLARAQANAAEAVGEIQVCKGLGDGRYDSCVTAIAYDDQDVTKCKTLSGDAKTSCEDGVYLRVARTKGDEAFCEKIANEVRKISCVSSLDTAFSPAVQAAVDGGNPQACDTLSSDEKGICEDLFTSLDVDQDGLSLAEEFAAGTSPTNADTDGDGYTDGVEVHAGFDPLK